MIATASLLLLAQFRVTVPHGPTPQLDGIVQPGEWDVASTASMPGATLRIMRDHGGVFVLVQAEAVGIAHLCVARNDTVRVLHASASLGAATYVKAGDTWSNTEQFVWKVRDRNGQSAARAEQDQHLVDHGWTATTSSLGARTREFHLNASWLTPSTRLGLAWLALPGGIATWPSELADGCADLPLAMGTAPSQLRFAPPSWAVLESAVATPR